MKFFITVLISLFAGIAAYAQDVAALIKEGNRLEAVPDEKGAFKKFKEQGVQSDLNEIEPLKVDDKGKPAANIGIANSGA